MPQRRTIKLAGNAAQHINKQETDCTSDRGIGAATITEGVVGCIHSKSPTNWSIHDDQLCTPACACRAPVEIKLFITHSLENRHNNRHVSRQTTRHDRVDRHFLCGNWSLPHSFDANDRLRCQIGRVQKLTYAFFSWWNDW